MTDSNNSPITPSDLRDRLAIIESMLSEGRSKTESWGWNQ